MTDEPLDLSRHLRDYYAQTEHHKQQLVNRADLIRAAEIDQPLTPASASLPTTPSRPKPKGEQ